MNKLLEFAQRHRFDVSEVAGALVIRAPDKVWSWVVYEGLLSHYAEPYKSAQCRQQYGDDQEAYAAALKSMEYWLLNAERC